MKGQVFNNLNYAGVLERDDQGTYIFTYDEKYIADPSNKSISLTLPKRRETYRSEYLFAFFMGLLSEGVNKDIQCRLLKIDEEDDFSRLLENAGDDTIGAITIKKLIE